MKIIPIRATVIGLAVLLFIALLLKVNWERFTSFEAQKPEAHVNSVTLGVIGMEPELYPNMDDQLVWLQEKMSCMNSGGVIVELVSYMRPVSDGVQVAVQTLSLAGVRVAYRVGYYGGPVFIEVMHVRNTQANNWVKYDWEIPAEARASQLRAMDELGLTEKQFRQCFGKW